MVNILGNHHDSTFSQPKYAPTENNMDDFRPIDFTEFQIKEEHIIESTNKISSS